MPDSPSKASKTKKRKQKAVTSSATKASTAAAPRPAEPATSSTGPSATFVEQLRTVADKASGVTCCGKEVRLLEQGGERYISLSLRMGSLMDGWKKWRSPKNAGEFQNSTPQKRSGELSLHGSLQWLATLNKAAKEAEQHRMQVVFKNLVRDSQLIVYTDTGVGVETTERETDDILQSSLDKRLVYSQKGAVVGFVERGSTEVRSEHTHLSIVDWSSSTNKRVIFREEAVKRGRRSDQQDSDSSVKVQCCA